MGRLGGHLLAMRLSVAAFAAVTAVGCAHPRRAPIQSGQQPSACYARIEETSENTGEGWWLRVRLFNESGSELSGPVSRLVLGFQAAPIPARVSAPPNWDAFIRVCDDGRMACEVAWAAGSYHGLERGSALSGFDVLFTADHPSSTTFQAELATCAVGGVS
jgi:hypothetical protein